MDFPAPSLNGNTYLSDGMVVRFNPDGVAVPIGYVNNSDDGAKKVVRDFLIEKGISNAPNFHDGLEWRVLYFRMRMNPFLPNMASHERHRQIERGHDDACVESARGYLEAYRSLLTEGFRRAVPVEVAGAFADKTSGLARFLSKYEDDFADLFRGFSTGLSVSADGLTVSEEGRKFVYSKSVFESDRPVEFGELMYGRSFAGAFNVRRNVHNLQSDLVAHFNGGVFSFEQDFLIFPFFLRGPHFYVLVRPKSEGSESFSIQPF